MYPMYNVLNSNLCFWTEAREGYFKYKIIYEQLSKTFNTKRLGLTV